MPGKHDKRSAAREHGLVRFDSIRERAHVVPRNIGVQVIFNMVVRIGRILQLSENEGWPSRVFFLNRVYRPNDDVCQAPVLEISRERSGSHA